MEKKCRIGISNMHCTNCSGAVEKHFNSQDGINVKVLLSTNEGIFSYDDSKWDIKRIEKNLKSIGYPMTKDQSKSSKELIKIIVCVVLIIPILIFMSLHNKPLYIEIIELLISTIVLSLLGFPFIKGMIRDFKNKRLGMDVLVSLGCLVSYIYSLVILITQSHASLYFDSCAMLLTIISIGKYIEKQAKIKTSSSLKELMSLQEKEATVIRNNELLHLNIEDILIDDILVVGVGQKIPLDGIIVDNTITINESMISGESLPKTKEANDIVYAGTIIVEGNTKIKVTKVVNETYLSSLINKVEEIQASKPRLQKIADKVASIFVPSVLLLSVVCFIVTLVITKDISISINRAVSVLVISCPCSLGLATPLSILIGSSKAIKMGIIYNNADIFEKTNKINTIAFDKTGTLSYGEFEVTNIECKDNKYLDIIYTLESVSTHPLAKALQKYCKENNSKLINLNNIKEIIGKGIESDNYFIYKDNNKVILKENDEIVSTITLIDKIKENSKNVIDVLKENKIDSYILSGDNKETALIVGINLGINENNIFYEVKPEDKLNIIEDLQRNNCVCFVGDGINDSLALNKADLSISMGNGSDIAKSSSDITLTNNDLFRIIDALKLSKRIYKNIVTNFIWAFSYNIIAIPLAFMGVINPMIASICMAVSNLLVVTNSLRLLIDRNNGKI